jgi:hypothetical protein
MWLHAYRAEVRYVICSHLYNQHRASFHIVLTYTRNALASNGYENYTNLYYNSLYKNDQFHIFL